ncbi:hypothetical protein Dsin_014190 [Dipteronia sinensis]|uniref:Ankyrin repeat protein n=1 Tax=Dipteronia sinensis TaxID=43782 RepID=A0AAE0AM53_9ROSI|nr:hypothetical protein Dsin_014190 [Dipteronia sinensis]
METCSHTMIAINPSEGSFQRDLGEAEDLNDQPEESLYLAALGGNWENAERIIKKNPGALTAKISMLSLTALHVSAFSGHSKFVEKLVEIMSPEQVALPDLTGNTAHHHAATAGSVKAAMALLKKNPALTEYQGNQGFIPLLSAVVYGAEKGKEMTWFPARRTPHPSSKLLQRIISF